MPDKRQLCMVADGKPTLAAALALEQYLNSPQLEPPAQVTDRCQAGSGAPVTIPWPLRRGFRPSVSWLGYTTLTA